MSPPTMARRRPAEASRLSNLPAVSSHEIAPASSVQTFQATGGSRTQSLVTEGISMTVGMIWWFFRRKLRIVFFAAITYAALC